ncbi:hypothetical protein BGZ98_001493 [Dissophora globulifera]|nr:hypothetical protein BGZ98_001493 [Dissophora globulifera]
MGRRAFAEVYWWIKDGTQMAVKRIRVTDGGAADIARETDIVSRLAHKHIIQCYGIGRDANYVYIVTDYAEGGNLKDAAPSLDWENKKRIVAEVALGLAYLHSQDVIHRDIKGANILLTKHNEVKLCDFGLAKVIASATCASTYIQKGTLRWMAPELRKARPKYSAQSDIFALGVVMQELVDEDTPQDYMEILTRCQAEDPMERPTLTEIVDAFYAAPWVPDGAAEDNHINEKHETLIDEQYEIGVKFFNGDEVDVNRAEAAERFRRAGSMGHPMAQYILGSMYHHGDGVLRDYTKSVEWLQRAAEKGHASARLCLGISYREGGEGVPQDYSKSFDLLQAAAYQKNPRACSELGWMYLHGLGVAQSQEEAIHWYREAAELGCSKGQINMAVIYYGGKGVEQDYVEAARFMSMAAAQGEAMAQYYLGDMYADGKGVSKDFAEALKYWTKAAEGGSMDAQRNLGGLYMGGVGVRRNIARGLMWLGKAAEQGDAEARYMYEAMRNGLAK